MITRLAVQNYKSIADITLQLSDINIFVGPNGVGKSNILDVLKFVRDAASESLDQAITHRQGIASIRRWSPTKPYHVNIAIDVKQKDRGFGQFSFTLSSFGDEYKVEREEAVWRGSYTIRRRVRGPGVEERATTVREHYRYTRDKNGNVAINDYESGERTTTKIEDEGDFFINTLEAFRFRLLHNVLGDFESYAIFPNTLRSPEKQSKEVYLQSHGENLASLLRRIRKKKGVETINEVVEAMKKILPSLNNITVQSVAGLLTPQFLVRDEQYDKLHYFHVNQVSDGTLRILGLLVALYQEPRPATMALEEPELTVHPGALQVIADAVKEVSRSAQIVVTTHSPSFLDNFEPHQVIAVESDEGHTIANKVRKAQVEAVKKRLFTLGEIMHFEGLQG